MSLFFFPPGGEREKKMGENVVTLIMAWRYCNNVSYNIFCFHIVVQLYVVVHLDYAWLRYWYTSSIKAESSSFSNLARVGMMAFASSADSGTRLQKHPTSKDVIP